MCKGIDMRKVYLLSTEHLENGLWFRDAEDFKVAMIYVAIEALHHPKGFVLAFILMSNHVHFVLKGKQEEVIAFVNRFKHRYSKYYRRKYGVKEFLRGNEMDVKEIPYDDEGVERAIAYVLMNCVAAGICTHPSQYPWGTGGIYFCPAATPGKLIKELSARSLKRLLHSDFKNFPEDWILGPDGYILPSAYVDVKTVESIFRTPQRMNYFLQNSSKAKKRLAMDENLPAFRDQTIFSALPDLCMSLFQKKSFQQLAADEQSEFARQIRFRFSADATQIARVCGVSYADAARLLDGV
jgi:REP element-mobilizing transposase RayT